MWKYWKRGSWNTKKIAFVAILIATSVAFILVFNSIVPITSIPSFKLMAGGLPIKITGYIFGPLIGAITGVVADLLSFTITPTFIHWWYTLAFALAGAVPGMVGWVMFRRWKNKSATIKKDEYHYNTVNFIITLIVLACVIAGITIFIVLQGDDVFASDDVLIHNKFIFLGVAVAGSSTMFVAIVIFRFIFKPKIFNSFLPIVTFSAILELINTPLITLGDLAVMLDKNDSGSFVTILTAHLLLSPAKIWGNLLVVYFAYKITAPLIFNKTSNGWDAPKDYRPTTKETK